MTHPYTNTQIHNLSDNEAAFRLAMAAGYTACYADDVDWPTEESACIYWWDPRWPSEIRFQLYIEDHRGPTGPHQVLCESAEAAAEAVAAAYLLAGIDNAPITGTPREIIDAGLVTLNAAADTGA